MLKSHELDYVDRNGSKNLDKAEFKVKGWSIVLLQRAKQTTWLVQPKKTLEGGRMEDIIYWVYQFGTEDA
jgi:hypothetical protein